jgi:hypothetical protein
MKALQHGRPDTALGHGCFASPADAPSSRLRPSGTTAHDAQTIAAAAKGRGEPPASARSRRRQPLS